MSVFRVNELDFKFYSEIGWDGQGCCTNTASYSKAYLILVEKDWVGWCFSFNMDEKRDSWKYISVVRNGSDVSFCKLMKSSGIDTEEWVVKKIQFS